MSPGKRVAFFAFLFAFAFFVSFGTVQAQTKKSAAKKPPAKAVVKKTTAKSKDARKDTRTAAAKSKSNPKDKKATAKNARNAKNDRSAKNAPKAKKLSKAEQAKLDVKNKKTGKKPTLAERRAEAKRKKEEEARRRAAIAEQRRREEAARIARERRLAFLRGLKTETQANIIKDQTEGEDLRIREAAVEASGDRAGTVVVMESQTGKIVTMVNQDWAIRNSFKPCSTIKLVTGVAGVNENVITDDGAIAGDASSLTLDSALAYSKNPYFQRVGSKVGSTKMVEYARELGLGQKTGINADGETPGRVPYGNNNLRIYSHGDDFEVTPLQLAVLVSALSNGGKKVVPHISKPKVERAGYRPQFNGSIGIPQEKFENLLPGMMGAAEYGTARRGVDPSLGIAGKTGSCIGGGSWVGLFASVAPVENPKYAVVVITRGDGERGRYAAGVAHRIYRELAPRITRDLTRYAALKHQTAPSNIDSQTADADEEDDDDAMAEALTGTEQKVIVVGAQELRKTVIKTAQSKPVFKPVVIPYNKDTKSTEPAKSRPRVIKNER
ncbi:MAG: penicillin-binding transpeptidase domain-containing protein [Pyrinomonadaceae bacterium]